MAIYTYENIDKYMVDLSDLWYSNLINLLTLFFSPNFYMFYLPNFLISVKLSVYNRIYQQKI